MSVIIFSLSFYLGRGPEGDSGMGLGFVLYVTLKYSFLVLTTYYGS